VTQIQSARSSVLAGVSLALTMILAEQFALVSAKFFLLCRKPAFIG
jgi:hypothetical protein